MFFEFPGLYRDLKKANGISEMLGFLFHGPGWKPTKK